MKAITSLLFGIATVATALGQQPSNDNTRPNIVFILTDDQDKHLDSLKYMPLLQRHIIDKGTVFNRHYCTTAVCCPSRVSLWTGRNAHNTNVTDVFPPYGGYPKFVAQGFNSAYLPIWLQDAGYNTFYTGKLFNAHTVLNYHNPFPAGWTTSDFLLDPFTYQYLNATTQRNRDPPVSWEGHYSTDVLASKAYGLLEDAIALKNPFFLTVATNAPHSNVAAAGIHEGMPIKDVLAAIRMTAPIPAERHKHLFPDVRVPRTANFNPAQQHKVSWLKNLARLNDTVIEYNDYFYRQRLRALQAVDEIVQGLVTRLDDAGILENTYVIYSTDNGFHISQHRLNPGKECGFEEDINIPLIIRGPGVPVGETDVVTAHTDLAPTFLKIAGVKPRGDFDGTAIPLDEGSLREAMRTRQEHVNVEFWGRSLPEGTYGFSLDDGTFARYGLNNTYKGLRVIGEGYSLYYAVWCTNEHELYNLIDDPGQTRNIHPSTTPSSPSTSPPQSLLNIPLPKLIQRLDALLLVTKSCKGATCVRPWSVLHPDGSVSNLRDALNAKYDAFYAFAGNRVSFSECALGYIREVEGEQDAPAFGIDYLLGGESAGKGEEWEEDL